MPKKRTRFSYTLTFLLTLIVGVAQWSSCAFDQAPSGGPGDTTPPKVLTVKPDSGTVYFKGDRITIEFDKYMNRSSLQSALVFAPTVSEYEIVWSGKEVEIIFEEPLKPNRTYTYTVTNALKDFRGNPIPKSFTFAFSTGAVIDSGKISGTVFGVNNRRLKGATVFAFVADSLLNLDTLSLNSQTPDYIAQTDELGGFELSYLQEGNYLLFSFEDKNQNRRLEPDEPFGLPSLNVKTGNEKVLIKLFATSLAQKAEFRAAKAIDHGRLLIQYSSPPEPQFLSKMSLQIVDKTTGENKRVFDFTAVPSASDLIAVFCDSLPARHQYALIQSSQFSRQADSTDAVQIDTLSFETDPRDYQTPEPRSTPLRPLTADTLPLRLSSFPTDSSQGNFLRFTPSPTEGIITLSFLHPIRRKSLETAVQLFENRSASPLDLIINPIHASRFELRPKKGFSFGASYNLVVSGKKLLGVLGNPIQDTTFTIFFTTASSDEFGEMEGLILKSSRFNNSEDGKSKKTKREGIIVAEFIGEGIRYRTRYSFASARNDSLGKSPFVFPRLPEGRYFISAFETSTDTLEWNSGSLSPYRLASPFVIGEDSIRIRRRWKTNAPSLQFQLP
ncbi:MAG: Ig-like domain-containing protein [Chloroherpetonaceae bacterium]|nr:Ig-like domain-containing protein [Chloroherpetonaceae bacterium]